MKQYELAIQALQEAIDKLRDTHIFPDEVIKLEISLGCDILYLKGCEKKRLEESQSLSQGVAISNDARVCSGVTQPISPERESPLTPIIPGKVLPEYSGKATNSQPRAVGSITSKKPIVNPGADNSIQARRMKQLKELKHER